MNDIEKYIGNKKKLTVYDVFKIAFEMAEKRMINSLEYLNVDYITANIEEIIELEPLLPINFLLNLNDIDKIKFVADRLDVIGDTDIEKASELRYPSLKEGETMNDYEIRKLFEFVEKHPEHKELIIEKYR